MLYRRLMRGYVNSEPHIHRIEILANPRVTLRFYPGLATPHLPSITAGSQEQNDRIGAPDGFFENPSSQWDNMEDARAGPGRSRLPNPARATRVVGSFEHPILPMPPVRNFNE